MRSPVSAMVPSLETYRHRLERLNQVFLEENQKLNLSAFRREADSWIGNVLDSLAIFETGLLAHSPIPSRAEFAPTPFPSPVTGEGCRGEGKTHVSKGIDHLTYPPKAVIHHAREMRKRPTKAEALLWERIRNRALNNYYFRRQRPVGNFIIDFYCEEIRLGIEIDGPNHAATEQKEYDNDRTNELEARGIRIIRFTNDEVLNDLQLVLERIQTAIKKNPPEERVREEENTIQKQELRVLDLGTGGGFPLLPLAVCCPTASFTGMDATQKKIAAVENIARRMGISNVQLIVGRAEELGHNPEHREQYDLVLSRAVAPLNVLLEYCAPFVKVGGFIVLWKSMKLEQELKDALLARAELSCQLTSQHEYTLPAQWGRRQLVLFRKRFATKEKYPREVGVPKKKPLL